jgi:hypothetical protein
MLQSQQRLQRLPQIRTDERTDLATNQMIVWSRRARAKVGGTGTRPRRLAERAVCRWLEHPPTHSTDNNDSIMSS